MKKYLLFIISMLCVTIGAWAEDGTLTNDSEWEYSDNVLTITFSSQDDYTGTILDGLCNSYTGTLAGKTINKLVIKTAPGFTLNTCTNNTGMGNDEFYTFGTGSSLLLDLSQASLSTSAANGKYPMEGRNNDHRFYNVIVPDEFKANPASFELAKGNNDGSFDTNYYGVDGSTVVAKYATTPLAAISDLTSETISTLKVVGDLNTIDLRTIAAGKTIDLTEVTGGTGTITVPDNVTVLCKSADVESRVSPSTNVKNLVISCAASELAAKVSALAPYKPTSITLTGELTNDIMATLGGTDMSEVTHIDLSAATVAAGSNIANLTVPASLKQLVLPKAVNSASPAIPAELTLRLSGLSALDYVYIPTNDDGATTPDYVYVMKTGGLAQAFENESTLRSGKYIKVASNVALGTADVDFSALTNKPTQYIVLDFSGANMSTETVRSYRTPGENYDPIYRMILPDGWSGDDLANFCAVPVTWRGTNCAAVYSYTGTTLKILGVSNSYSVTALKAPRIVRTTTTTVEFVSGTYNNELYGRFSPNMLAAVNNAGKTSDFKNADGTAATVTSGNESVGTSIKSVRILTEKLWSADGNTSSFFTDLTFEDPTITTLNLTGIKNDSYGANQAVINLNGCTSLQGLNLDGVHAASVTANVSTLQTIGMSNVAIEGNVSFRGAIQTAFVASGRIAGDIDLTNNNKLGSIDIVNVEFKNASSVSTLQGSGSDGNLTTGDLIITRQYNSTNVTSSEDANWTATYGTTNDTYTAIIGKIRTSDTFGTGLIGSSENGRIYPQISAVATPPYSADVAGYEKNGCAISLTLDGTTEHYKSLSEALTFIANGETLEPCNLTINTTSTYSLRPEDITTINSVSFSSVAEAGDNANMYRDATLNLHGATLADGVSGAITNTSVHNIIMPKGLDKDVIKESNFSGCTNLNGVISLNDQRTALVAYVKKPGTLRQVLQQVAAFRPNVYNYMQNVNLPSVTLSGKLLASDIATNYEHLEGKAGEIGNFVETTPEVNASSLYIAAFENLATLRNLDISNAVFVDAADHTKAKCDNMTLSTLGWSGIVSLKMPTDESMNEVPKNFLRNCQQIPYLCIPYNYEKIGDEAFYLAGTYWITTTDSNGAEIDNGINTYTFSKNLKEIGTDPGEDTNGFPVYPANPVFGAVTSGQISDVYILRNGYEDGSFNPTKCYRGSFASGMTYGWGGFDGGNLYCREKYKNGAFLFTILHYPDMASLPESKKTTNTDLTVYYDAMEKAYTDVTKQYTKKDQTGALDANGDLLPWPTFSELGRAYNQAIRRLVWADWSGVYGETPDGNIIGGTINFDPNTHPDGVIDVAPQTRFPLEYVGWHEFVLSKATYVAPDEKVVNNVIYREYDAPQYYTFCVPFDMTPEEVLNLLGVPASTSKIKTKVGTFSPTSPETDEVNETDLYPQIYTLKSVTRTLGNNTANSVQLTLSKNLAKANSDGAYTYWTPTSITTTAGTGSYESNIINYGDGLTALGSEVMIRGGYPYLIKAYLPKGASVERGQLGKYVLSRYAFSMDASTAVRLRDNCYIALQGKTYYSYFAKPYDKHLVRSAYVENTNTHAGTTADNGYATGENIENYYYRFMGQYWDQYMPTNTYYLYHRDHKWYYNGSYDDWDWLPYTCIINACTGSNYLPDDDTEAGSVIPVSTVDDTEGHSVFTENLKLLYSTTDALDDELFPGSSARQYSFVFDDGDIVDIGENSGETTAIDRLNGVDIIPANSKVYNMNGQLVGKSLNGLSKGMYIVNGRKVVVK